MQIFFLVDIYLVFYILIFLGDTFFGSPSGNIADPTFCGYTLFVTLLGIPFPGYMLKAIVLNYMFEYILKVLLLGPTFFGYI